MMETETILHDSIQVGINLTEVLRNFCLPFV